MIKFVLVVVVIAIAIYLAVRAFDAMSAHGSAKPAANPRRQARPPARPLGPDDDPDFLWNLDKKKRHPDENPDS